MGAFRLAGAVAVVAVIAGCGQSSAPSGEPLGKHEQALSTGLVISAIYGGPAAGPYKNDWVEIFNRGTTPVVLTGKTLQYSRSDFPTWDVAANKTALTGTVAPGGYYLVALGVNTTGTTDLPTPDATGTTSVASGGALFALVNDAITLDCGPPPAVDGGADPDAGAAPRPCTSTSIIDFVGYGKAGALPKPAPVYEGTGAAPTGNSTSVNRRKGAGCVETDNNESDFELVTIATGPAPRNSATTPNLCLVGDGGTDAATDAVLDAVPDVVVDAVDAVVADVVVVPDTAVTDTGVKPDATPADTGTAPVDTGTPDPDTGSTPVDTGTPVVMDTGSATADTGTPVTTDEVVDDSGCGCRVAGGEEANLGAALAGLFFAVGALVRRRR